MKQHTTIPLSISHEWKRWIAECKLVDCSDEQIVDILIKQGFDAELATKQVSEVHADPYYEAGQWMTQKLRKMESLAEIRQALFTLSASAARVERRSDLSQQEFLENYYAANRPVVFTSLLKDWKALSLWDPEYLKKTCGDEMVEIMTNRERDKQYEQNSANHKSTICFRDYVDMVTGAGQTNDFYLVANNHFMEQEAVQQLHNDMELPSFLNREHVGGSVFLWFGPAGTVTPLHHDTMNILSAQIYGRKRVLLISPDQTHLVYNNVGVYSEVDCEQPDYGQHPLFQQVHPLEVVMEPGEALFLPVGWWHHVRSMDISITLTFTNFIFPNSYQWHHPYIYR